VDKKIPVNRQTLKDLLELGRIQAGTELIGKYKGAQFETFVTSEGELETREGKRFKTPSGAAKAFNGGKSVDGWHFWKLKIDPKIRLCDLRPPII
jgi:hypothetical protein